MITDIVIHKLAEDFHIRDRSPGQDLAPLEMYLGLESQASVGMFCG